MNSAPSTCVSNSLLRAKDNLAGIRVSVMGVPQIPREERADILRLVVTVEREMDLLNDDIARLERRLKAVKRVRRPVRKARV